MQRTHSEEIDNLSVKIFLRHPALIITINMITTGNKAFLSITTVAAGTLS